SLTVNDFTYARNDADFPESLRADPTRPERISDHDMPVAYFAVPRDTVAPAVTITGVTEGTAYRLAEAPTPGCLTSDAASGVQADATLAVTGADSTGAGALTATCHGAVDKVGNAAADVSVHYIVDGLPPVVTVAEVTGGAMSSLASVPARGCGTSADRSGVK